VSATTHQHYLPVREDWLATTPEEAIDPAQPIIDPHHHLWDRPGWRYLLDEILADLRSGHDIRATVHVQARSMYRADAPAALAPVGETEFVNGIAAMSASGQYGKVRIAAGIVGFADLRLGAAVREVLEAHIAVAGGANGPLPRHPPHHDLGSRSRHAQPRQCGAGRHDGQRRVPRGLRGARQARPQLRCLAAFPPDTPPDRARPRLPRHADRAEPLRRRARHRALHARDDLPPSGSPRCASSRPART
jgi:hypothetical protein